MKIPNCICGAKAVIEPLNHYKYVQCEDVRCCFSGPFRKTQRNAIKIWSEIVKAYKEAQK